MDGEEFRGPLDDLRERIIKTDKLISKYQSMKSELESVKRERDAYYDELIKLREEMSAKESQWKETQQRLEDKVGSLKNRVKYLEGMSEKQLPHKHEDYQRNTEQIETSSCLKKKRTAESLEETHQEKSEQHNHMNKRVRFDQQTTEK